MREPILAYKGLMHYDPDEGWARVDPEAQADANVEPQPVASLSPRMSEAHDFHQVSPSAEGFVSQDPLLEELFDQLHDPQSDEVANHWKFIAQRVNLLSEGMSQRRQIKQQLQDLDAELDDLRQTILKDLDSLQRVAEHQLVQAKLRAEVSHLARHRLSSHLRSPLDEE